MKMESQVIVDQQATVNMYPNLVHTARHALEIDVAWNKNKTYNCNIHKNLNKKKYECSKLKYNFYQGMLVTKVKS